MIHAETEGQVPESRTKVNVRAWLRGDRGSGYCSGGRRIHMRSSKVAPLKILRAPLLQ